MSDQSSIKDAPVPTLKIVTWNILHPDHIKVYDLNTKYLDYSYRLPKIISKLREFDADIICLQEADSSSVEDNFAELSNYNLVWQDDRVRKKKLQQWRNNLSDKKPHTLVCAILVKKNIELINHRVGSRSLTANLKIGVFVIELTNVHLEAGHDTTDIHIKHLTKLAKTADIICGDFNDYPDEPAIKYLEDQGYLSAYSGGCPSATYVSKYENGSRMIVDHIYYRLNLKLIDIEWTEFKGLSQDHPSDHIPIFCVLTLT